MEKKIYLFYKLLFLLKMIIIFRRINVLKIESDTRDRAGERINPTV